MGSGYAIHSELQARDVFHKEFLTPEKKTLSMDFFSFFFFGRVRAAIPRLY
jgi:hypothetical protein